MADRRHIFTRAQFAVSDRTLTGYAIRWNTLSDDRGNYCVRLLPGSAKFSTPTLGLFGHDWTRPIANTSNQTLTLTPDDIGVKFSMAVARTSVGDDTLALVRDGYIAGMSFAMVDAPTGKSVTENGLTIFEASDFLCDEISVVTNPSFLDTSVGIQQPAASPIVLAPSYANRTAHNLRLQRFKLDLCRLS